MPKGFYTLIGNLGNEFSTPNLGTWKPAMSKAGYQGTKKINLSPKENEEEANREEV